MAGGMGAGGEPENRQLARMADARDLSGLLRLPEISPLPKVTGVGREPEGRLWGEDGKLNAQLLGCVLGCCMSD